MTPTDPRVKLGMVRSIGVIRLVIVVGPLLAAGCYESHYELGEGGTTDDAGADHAPVDGADRTDGDADAGAETLHDDATTPDDGHGAEDVDLDALCADSGGIGNPPVPLYPPNGAVTGSLWSPSPQRLPLQPGFRWTWTPDGGPDPMFEVQVDDSCPRTGFQDCCFPSPEAAGSGLGLGGWRVETPLSVDETPPVGRRYYWRVRGCRPDGCSPWSAVRYLEVGRARHDANGDGYSDLLVGASGWAHASLFLGGAAPDATPDVTLIGSADDAYFGSSLAWVGDVNGDGFGDFVAGSPGAHGYVGRLFLFLGGPAPDDVPELTLDGRGSNASFGLSVGAAGDVDADGRGDFLVGSPMSGGGHGNSGEAYLFLGGDPPDAAPDATFEAGIFRDVLGAAVASADLNADGTPDVIVGAPGYDPEGYGPGQVYVYFAQTPFDSVADVTLRGEDENGYFGSTLATEDFDGDTIGDLVVGAPYAGGEVGRAYWYRGGAPFDPAPSATFTGDGEERFGSDLAAGEAADDTSVSNLLVGAPGDIWGDDSVISRVYLLAEGEGPLSTTYGRRSTAPGVPFGVALATGGDMTADGWPDLVVGTSSGISPEPGRVQVWFGGEMPDWDTEPSDLELAGSVAGDQFGGTLGQ